VGDHRRLTIAKIKQNNVSALKMLELSPRSIAAIQAIGSIIMPEQQSSYINFHQPAKESLGPLAPIINLF